MRLIRRILYWAGPFLLCLLLYWKGLLAWFQMDDFAWLALHLRVHDFQSFLSATFTPYAQGTIRPISERLFFMGLFSLFGMEALPFRLAVFATQGVNLILITLIMRRLTGSAIAGFAAPALWIVNSNLYWPMTWTSAYNQILCSTVLLLAFYLFVLFTETGAYRYYAWQWIAFLIGFGVLELVVVYPAVAALYALLRARRYLKYALPMLLASAGYTLLHRFVQAPSESATYKMYFDPSMLSTGFVYVRWALAPSAFVSELGLDQSTIYALQGIIAIALIVFAASRLRKGDLLPIFFLGWFVLVLGPYVPLRNHITDYYLTVPTIGLAMLGGYAMARLSAAKRARQVLVAVVVLIYAVPSAASAYLATSHHSAISSRVQNFVERLAYAHKRNPGKTLLISNVDSDLFWTGFYDQPYRIFGLNDVFLTADTEPQIELHFEHSISRYLLAETVAREGIRKGAIVVYQVADARLRNVTEFYRATLDAKGELQLPRRIVPGNPLYSIHLREGWSIPEPGFRWMMKRASFEIGVPNQRGAFLKITGFCPAAQFKRGALVLTVTVNGQTFLPSRIEPPNESFELSYPLPPDAEAKRVLNVTLEVDRTITAPPDTRELGLALERFEIVEK